jgi:hypothetical protein
VVTQRVYADDGRQLRIDRTPGVRVLQISRPRELGPLILVVGLFLILLIVTLLVGAPQR